MSVLRLFVFTFLVSILPLAFAYTDHLPLFVGPVPDELTVEYNGTIWAWASPCAGGCMDDAGELISPIDPSVQPGWRYCTTDEMMDIPDVLDFIGDGFLRCAAPYFDNHNQSCDFFDLLEGNITSEPNNTTDETLLCFGPEQGEEFDSDLDGISDEFDLCIDTPDNQIADLTGCSVNQLCPCDGIDSAWKNHGKYVSCISEVAEGFVEMELITDEEKDEIVSASAQSSCGHKNR